MAYARWSDGNWYIWWDCDDFLACHHKKGGRANYNYGDNIDEFVKNFPQKLSGKDEYDLRCCIKNFNEDYETEKNEQMSKDKPEVGDIWKDKDIKYRIYHIIAVNDYSVIVADIHLWKSEFSIEVFKSFCTYLGKSKANIDDLFKTENEE